ncbi:Fic/DOC family protein [Mycolicibacterium mageritense]|uniref:Fic/DOC family protein n=1 Tax=Mycolicibacterium mageritense TaxID=53462 RepID=UPI001E4EEFF2|nr:Fic family protein [Mycolicibacterium mageritense]MCC9184813.1 Fic family protein [Mycolicibacterium mageritense]
MSDYSQWDDYFWPHAPDVLRNKLGIRDPNILSFVEAQITAVRMYQQVLEGPTGAFDFAHYCDVHRRTFGDIYEWAGRPRTVPNGPMTKRGPDVVNFDVNDPAAPKVTYHYRPGPQVRDSAEYVFDRLKAEQYLSDLPPEEFVERLGRYWGTIDSVHPFREGNTRTETIFFHQLCRNAGYDLGAEQLHARRAEFLAARFHGHAIGDRYRRLTALLHDTVQPRRSRELTARETQWARRLYDTAERNADLIRRATQTRQGRGEDGLEL